MSFTFQAAFDLSGKVALVTGGASGIGNAISSALAERGARVAIADLSAAAADAAAALSGEGHIGITGDITKPGEPERIVADAVNRLGRLDILINNAGVAVIEQAEDVTDAAWDFQMAVNLKGPFVMSRAAFPALCRAAADGGGARVVNIASQASFIALDGHLAYCASKAGVLMLTKVMAAEWGEFGITVNAISPTVVNTELGRRVWAGEVGETFRRKLPVGRFAEPEEIALAVLYLASGAAGMITGENLVVDGGFTIQ
jgi:2-deoxy-D-gluconate 3-dehydrogenase